MSTLPRISKFPPSELYPRPQSDFDTGVNTSTAWTEHLENGPRKYLSESDVPGSLSDEEPDENDGSEDLGVLPIRLARTLYQFEGKPEFRELSTEAGDAIYVLKEEVGDGWSLVKNSTGEVGLLPKSYYTVCLVKTRPLLMNNLR